MNTLYRIHQRASCCPYKDYNKEKRVSEDTKTEQISINLCESEVSDRDQTHTQYQQKYIVHARRYEKVVQLFPLILDILLAYL